jgi:ABC-type multidrug transport system ATPase subunit
VIEVRGLRRSFQKREVLAGVDVTVAAGERVALRGPNGSGKSTLLRCILGAIEPNEGDVLVGGHRAGTVEARRLIGATLSQDRSFYLRLSGRDNLLFFARVRGVSLRAARVAVNAVVEELEVEEIARKRLSRCSTGMIQQLGFARSLLGDPPVLLLDEPTRSLDADAAERLWAALARRPAAAVVIATHREEDVTRCTRIHELSAPA